MLSDEERKERNKEAARKYRAANRQTISVRRAQDRKDNIEKYKTRERNNYYKHRDSILLGNKLWRENNKEKLLNYNKLNKERKKLNYVNYYLSNQKKFVERRCANRLELADKGAAYKLAYFLGVRVKDLPSELIEAKLAIIAVKRKVKEMTK